MLTLQVTCSLLILLALSGAPHTIPPQPFPPEVISKLAENSHGATMPEAPIGTRDSIWFFLLQHVALIVITIKITLNYFTAARFEEVPPHFII